MFISLSFMLLQFTDMKPEEIATFMGHKPSILGDHMTARKFDYTPVSDLPASLDWRSVSPPVLT